MRHKNAPGQEGWKIYYQYFNSEISGWITSLWTSKIINWFCSPKLLTTKSVYNFWCSKWGYSPRNFTVKILIGFIVLIPTQWPTKAPMLVLLLVIVLESILWNLENRNKTKTSSFLGSYHRKIVASLVLIVLLILFVVLVLLLVLFCFCFLSFIVLIPTQWATKPPTPMLVQVFYHHFFKSNDRSKNN